jgi:hypothetical protein
VGQAGYERSGERLHLSLYLIQKDQQTALDEIPIKGDTLVARLAALEFQFLVARPYTPAQFLSFAEPIVTLGMILEVQPFAGKPGFDSVQRHVEGDCHDPVQETCPGWI